MEISHAEVEALEVREIGAPSLRHPVLLPHLSVDASEPSHLIAKRLGQGIWQWELVCVRGEELLQSQPCVQGLEAQGPSACALPLPQSMHALAIKDLIRGEQEAERQAAKREASRHHGSARGTRQATR